MEKETIESGNKAIAIFDGKGYWQAFTKEVSYKPYWATHYISKEECESAIKKYFESFGEPRGIDYSETINGFEAKFIVPEYHSDWNLLMPVVEKINEGGHNVKIFKGGCQINSGEVDRRDQPTLILNVWLAVVDFIKHLNNQS